MQLIYTAIDYGTTSTSEDTALRLMSVKCAITTNDVTALADVLQYRGPMRRSGTLRIRSVVVELCPWAQMRDNCDPWGGGGVYRMARGWRYTIPSLASASLHVARLRVCYRHTSVFDRFPVRLCNIPLLDFCCRLLFFVFVFMLSLELI